MVDKKDAERRAELQTYLALEAANTHPDKATWMLPATNELIELHKKMKYRKEVTAWIA